MADLLPRHATVAPGATHSEHKRKDIQALRALAVGMVVVYHPVASSASTCSS